MDESRSLPPGVRQGKDGDYTCLVSDDGTRIQLCGVWYLDDSESKAKKALASVNGVMVAVCSKCGCRVAFKNDRFCRGCGKMFED